MSRPEGPFPEWKRNFIPRDGFEASGYPAGSAWLEGEEGRQREGHIVLFEDTYETSFGDGKFHYFKAVDVLSSLEELLGA